jgi:hypothetical protein
VEAREIDGGGQPRGPAADDQAIEDRLIHARRMLSFPGCSSSNKRRGGGVDAKPCEGIVELIVTFLVLVVLSAGLGFVFGQRSNWSRRRVALVAALPIPIITWGLGAVLLAMVSIDRADMCESAGCSNGLTAAAVMAVLGLIAYALGIVFALVGLQFARPRSRNSIHDVPK